MNQKQYAATIELIQEGIKIAIKEKQDGTVFVWKADLLKIYQRQKDSEKILSLAEDLFFFGRNDSREYYRIIKKHTAQQLWPETLERLLAGMEKEKNGFNDLHAEILIEHNLKK